MNNSTLQMLVTQEVELEETLQIHVINCRQCYFAFCANATITSMCGEGRFWVTNLHNKQQQIHQEDERRG